MLGNDRAIPDVSLNPASLSIVSGAAHGTITINTTTGVVTYQAVAGHSGTDTFSEITYTDESQQTSGSAFDPQAIGEVFLEFYRRPTEDFPVEVQYRGT